MDGSPAAKLDGDFQHQPVLAAQVLHAFADLPAAVPDGPPPTLLDGTLGGGGHAGLLLAAHPSLQLIGLDQDPTARVAAAAALARFAPRVEIVATNFADFRPDRPLQGVLVDLGVSSPQLDRPERGFSFRQAGPLDMRMNTTAGETAAQLIDRLDEAELADVIYAFGEERLSRRIARRIKERGPWSDPAHPRDTLELAYLVAGCHSPAARRGRIHTATRTFQALRIAVNRELEALDHLLRQAPAWLAPGGVLAIISFHSLEDRRVKQAFLSDPRLERISRRAMKAAEAEQQTNPRSRSARLRLARRVADA